MATSKTLAPTNVTISIPAMADAPDASVFSNCVDKEADAINALNSHTAKYWIKTATVAKNGGTATVNWSEFGTMANNRAYTVLINGANVTWRYAGFLFLGGGSTAIVEVAKSYLSVTVNGTSITVTNTHPDYDQNINIEIMGNM